MSSNLAIRISRTYDSLVNLVPLLKAHTTKLVVYEHPEDEKVKRTHIHLLAWECNVSTDTIKNWVKKLLDEKAFPRTDWTFKTTYKGQDEQIHPVDLAFISYMSKGKYEPRFVNNVDNVGDYKNQWVDKKVAPVGKHLTQYKLVQENPAVAKKRKGDTVQAMIDRTTKESSREDIIKVIREVLNEQKEVIGIYKVLDYYDTIIMRTRPNDFMTTIYGLLDKRKSH